MSVIALMLVRDEADIIEDTLRHLAAHVDFIEVHDNGSTDGTQDILADLQAELPLTVYPDPDPAYWQSKKMSEWAKRLHSLGLYDWIVPCDADELWYGPDGKRLGDWLDSIGREAQVARAALFNYFPPCEGFSGSPVKALQWRSAAPGALPKAAGRLHRKIVIQPGNHGITYGPGSYAVKVDGATIRHYSWRTPEQYLRKIRNGIEAYALTDLPEGTGTHWRMFADATDEAIMAHFTEWFCIGEEDRRGLVYDPAPCS